MSEFPRWASKAFDELLMDVREIPGSEHSARILEYHRATSLGASDDETPWCAAFVNWCLQQVGVRGTGLANARSFMSWGDKLVAPRPGCIVVYWRGSRDGWQGHVGFYLGNGAELVQTLGGNQGNRVSIARYPDRTVLGYRWPKPTDYYVNAG